MAHQHTIVATLLQVPLLYQSAALVQVTSRVSILAFPHMRSITVSRTSGVLHMCMRSDRSTGNGPLWVKTLATNATHAGGYVELDVHNMWGMMEEKATHTAVLDILSGKRAFLIGRSTFPSSGRWTGHWVSVDIFLLKRMFINCE